jgi:hypothetical protein
LSIPKLSDLVLFGYFAILLIIYSEGRHLNALLERLWGSMGIFDQTWLWSVAGIDSGGTLVLILATLAGGGIAYGLAQTKVPERHWPVWLREVALVCTSLVMGLVFWYFRAGQAFGDHGRYLLQLRDGDWFFMSSPLGSAIFAAAYRLVSRWQWSPDAAIGLVNCLAGVGWVYLLLKFAAELPPWNRKLLVAIVFPAGGLLLFFGYIEGTTLPLTIALAYVYLAWQTLRGQNRLWAAGLALGLAMPAHGSMLVLLPSFLIVCLSAWQQKRRAQILAAAALVILPALVIVSFALTHRDLIWGVIYGDAMGGGDSRMFIPLLKTSSQYEFYTLFSTRYFFELGNLSLMAAPFAAVLIVQAVRGGWQQRKNLWTWYAITIMAACSFLIGVWNSDLGMQRAWKLYTPLLMLMLVLGATLWPSQPPSRSRLVWLGSASGFSLAALALLVLSYSPAMAWDPWGTVWPRPAHVLRTRFGDARDLELAGFTLLQSTCRSGDQINVDLFWRARQNLPLDYTVGVYLLKTNGGTSAIVVQDDHLLVMNEPAAGEPYLSSRWLIGLMVIDRHTLVIPVGTPPGTYQLATAVYDFNTLQRLPIEAGETNLLPLTTLDLKTGN